MAPYHNPTCVMSVLVRLVPKVSITVVVTAKRMTKKAKKIGKMAILWLSVRYNGSLMALKIFPEPSDCHYGAQIAIIWPISLLF